jgi:hypothetical protein
MSLTLTDGLRSEPTILKLFAQRPRLVWRGRESVHLADRFGVTRDQAWERWRTIDHLLLHEDAEATDREYTLGLSWAWVPGYTAAPKVPLLRPETVEEFRLRITPGSPLDVVVRWIGFDGQEMAASEDAASVVVGARFIERDDAQAALRLLKAEGWLREDRAGRTAYVGLFDFRGGRDISLERPAGVSMRVAR